MWANGHNAASPFQYRKEGSTSKASIAGFGVRRFVSVHFPTGGRLHRLCDSPMPDLVRLGRTRETGCSAAPSWVRRFGQHQAGMVR
jgi:hypothetical protein